MTLLTLGVLTYFGFQTYRYFEDPLSTTVTYAYEVEEAVETAGTVVRTEQVLEDESSTLLRLRRSEGERVSVGGTVALVYADQSSVDRQAEIDSLTAQLEQLRFARESTLGAEVSARLDSQIFQNLVSYRSAVAAGRLDQAEDRGQTLRTLVLKRDYTPADMETLDAQIAQAEDRLRQLSAQATGAVRRITATASGLYSAVVDGYETVLTPASLEGITPSALAAVQVDGAVRSSVGKLILGDVWYYAAPMTASEAAALEKRQSEGESLTLRFSKGVERDLPVRLASVGPEESGRVVAVFQGQTYLQSLTLLRRQNAQVISGAVEGQRIPKDALRMVERTETGEDGTERTTAVTGVYCVVGAEARFKPVEVLYTGDNFLLVRSAPDLTAEKLRLRSGDEVIVQARDLFDGKVVASQS